MKTITFTEFRRTASSVLDYVEKGESIHILRHGRAIAKIILVAGERRSKPSWKRPGPRLVIPGVSLSKAVLAERRSAR
jgi:antitoxin (DNA-binding transcriptional repressor) of toxin-antitoxin stability system